MRLDIKGYDTAQAFTGEFETLPPGGYVCRIKDVKIDEANGYRSLVLAFDIDEGEYECFFRRKYDMNTAEQKKWPGVFRQPLATGDGSEKDNTKLSFFKGLITCIEDSNGFKWDKETDTLKGKLFGVLIRRKEWFSVALGRNIMLNDPFRARSVETIRSGKFEIPADYLLAKPSQDNIMPSAFDDDCPF